MRRKSKGRKFESPENRTVTEIVKTVTRCVTNPTWRKTKSEDDIPRIYKEKDREVEKIREKDRDRDRDRDRRDRDRDRDRPS